MPQQETERIYFSRGGHILSEGKMSYLCYSANYPTVPMSLLWCLLLSLKNQHAFNCATSEALSKLRVHYSTGRLTR